MKTDEYGNSANQASRAALRIFGDRNDLKETYRGNAKLYDAPGEGGAESLSENSEEEPVNAEDALAQKRREEIMIAAGADGEEEGEGLVDEALGSLSLAIDPAAALASRFLTVADERIRRKDEPEFLQGHFSSLAARRLRHAETGDCVEEARWIYRRSFRARVQILKDEVFYGSNATSEDDLEARFGFVI